MLDQRLPLVEQALENVEVLLREKPNDGELELLKARCLLSERKYEEAKKWYEAANQHRKDLLDPYAGLAAILRSELKRGPDADKVVVEMLKNNSKNFRAHLLVAEYWRTFWGLGQNATAAAKALAEAQKLPKDANVAPRSHSRSSSRGRSPPMS